MRPTNTRQQPPAPLLRTRVNYHEREREGNPGGLNEFSPAKFKWQPGRVL